MQRHLEQLLLASKKPIRRILGLMSGTSLDGLDIAICDISGCGSHTQLTLVHFVTKPYDDAFKHSIRAVFAKETIHFATLTVLNVQIAERHAQLIQEALEEWGLTASEIDCVASHGQTVFHAPRSVHGRADWPHATLQIGDGDVLAHKLGICVVHDFRQKHIAAGGEGAPLALYGDYFLFSQPGEERFLLNMGGISNFTYLPADGQTDKAIATDTGPGNTLLDAWAKHAFQQEYDADGRIAEHGMVQEGLLEQLLLHPFLQELSIALAQGKSKTTGPEMFSFAWFESVLDTLPKGQRNPYDIMATLAHFTAHSVAQGIKSIACTHKKKHVYLSGGGAHNPVIVKALKELLPNYTFKKMQALGMDGDAKEACLFAVLANETIAGKAQDTILGGVPLVGMGKVCFPD